MEAKFRIDADVHQLKDARQFVEETAARFQVAPEVISKLVLAVDELITNIMVHGYQGQAGTIEIDLRSVGDDLEIRLYDQSPPFDPNLIPDPDTHLPLDERPLGGMGIYLARKIMDSMTYRSTTDRGNELTLIKRAIIHAK
jgi:serine/threonine-protein kinase RsbW